MHLHRRASTDLADVVSLQSENEGGGAGKGAYGSWCRSAERGGHSRCRASKLACQFSTHHAHHACKPHPVEEALVVQVAAAHLPRRCGRRCLSRTATVRAAVHWVAMVEVRAALPRWPQSLTWHPNHFGGRPGRRLGGGPSAAGVGRPLRGEFWAFPAISGHAQWLPGAGRGRSAAGRDAVQPPLTWVGLGTSAANNGGFVSCKGCAECTERQRGSCCEMPSCGPHFSSEVGARLCPLIADNLTAVGGDRIPASLRRCPVINDVLSLQALSGSPLPRDIFKRCHVVRRQGGSHEFGKGQKGRSRSWP